jgi:ABC-type multidrug transport system fused ATPase/permease subunit
MNDGYHINDELQQRSYDGRLMRRLLGYTRPYRRGFIVATVLLLLLSVLNNITPLLIMQAVDRYINNPARVLLDGDTTETAALVQADMHGLLLVVAALACCCSPRRWCAIFRSLW